MSYASHQSLITSHQSPIYLAWLALGLGDPALAEFAFAPGVVLGYWLLAISDPAEATRSDALAIGYL
jgi:hypothetical protein